MLMKKIVTLFSLLFCLFSARSNAQVVAHSPVAVSAGPAFNYGRDFRMILERTQDKNDSLHYNKLLRRFLDNDSTLTRAETLALLIGFTENPNYKPLEMLETEKEIIELNDHGYYEDVLEESKKYLAKHPLSLSINKERSFAYHQLRMRDSARFFMDLADKIMEAMIYSGDGKGNKPEIAFFSLGLNDGDYFIPNVGMSVTGRKTQTDKSKRLLYVTTAMNDESVYKTYYFHIHHAKLKMDGDELREKQENKKLKKAQAKRKKGKGKKKEDPATDSTTLEVPAEIISDTLTEPQENEQQDEAASPVNAPDSLNMIPPAEATLPEDAQNDHPETPAVPPGNENAPGAIRSGESAYPLPTWPLQNLLANPILQEHG